jgi:hypothetical protein
MSTGKGIHLNGDKAWLEQLLNEKFGRIEDKMENFSKQIEIHRLAIQEIIKNEDECRDGMQKQIYLLLGKEQGLNAAHSQQIQRKEFSYKRATIYMAVLTFIMNSVFFIARNWYFYR